MASGLCVRLGAAARLKHDQRATNGRKIRDHALMHAPRFWWQPGRGLLLSPLSAIYGIAAALRLRRAGRRAGVPVICLGNLTVGGAGKTPAALAVRRILLASGERPFFLSRGSVGRRPPAGPGQSPGYRAPRGGAG